LRKLQYYQNQSQKNNNNNKNNNSNNRSTINEEQEEQVITHNLASQYTNTLQLNDNLESVNIYMLNENENENENKSIPVVIIYVNVPSSFHVTYANLLNEFLLSHFKPKQKIILLDEMSRGCYVQSHKEMILPLLRYIQTTAYKNEKQEKEKEEEKFQCLESGNLVCSVNASMLYLCEIQNKMAIHYVCISDLDFMSEMLIQLSNVLLFQECVELKHFIIQILQEKEKKFTDQTLHNWIINMCCDFGTNRNYLNTGINMFA